MKSVLISIHPKWCELIANGKKTVEVRKTKPKLETPFKVYIYCTKQGKRFIHGGIGEKECLFKNPDTKEIKFDFAFELMCCKNEYTNDNFLSGKVIGEFVCDKITYLGNISTDPWCSLLGDVHESHKRLVTKGACLTEEELLKYGGKYAWHISNLVIYDKPRELKEFSSGSSRLEFSNTEDGFPLKWSGMKRPPQSWCYVESEVEGE